MNQQRDSRRPRQHVKVFLRAPLLGVVAFFCAINIRPANSEDYIVWADPRAYKIQRAELDGSNVTDLVTGVTQAPHSVSVHNKSQMVYWTTLEPNYDPRSIYRTRLDGSYTEEIFKQSVAAIGMFGINYVGRKKRSRTHAFYGCLSTPTRVYGNEQNAKNNVCEINNLL